MYESASDFGLTVVKVYTTYESVLCPYHGDERPSGIFIKSDGVFYCKACGARRTVADLAKEAGLDYLPETSENPKLISLLEAADEERRLGYPRVTLRSQAMNYLQERQVSAGTTWRYGLEFDEWQQAIIFPHYNIWGVRIGNVGRVIEPDSKRMRYAVMGRKEPLWPSAHWRIDTKYLFVSEGPFKAMRLWEALQRIDEVSGELSDCPSLSTFGSTQRNDIWSLLYQCLGRVIMVADNDEAGLRYGHWFKAHGIRVVVPKVPFDEANDDLADEMLKSILEKDSAYGFL